MRDSPNWQRQDGSSMHARAVSLVEVVAAATCLGVLALWLVPALGGVSRTSKAGRCLSHLARIGYATSIYSTEDPGDSALPVHGRMFDQCPGHLEGGYCWGPRIYVGAYEWGGKSGLGRDSFVTGVPGNPLNSKFGSKAGFGPTTRPLNKILYTAELADAWADGVFDRVQGQADTELDLDLYHCPSDTGYTGIHCPSFAETGLTSYDHFGTSYNANIFMTAAGGGEMYSNSPYLHRRSEIINPAKTLAYQENAGRFAWMARPENPQCGFVGPGVPGTARGWHGKDWTFNAAFVDGHVDTIYMRGYRTEVVYSDDDSPQSQYRCIIIRGEGWQLDTLPAETVGTRVGGGFNARPSYEDCVGPDLQGGAASAGQTCIR